jgi:hypothetical protein
LPNVSWAGPGRVPSVITPGFVARANALGYRNPPRSTPCLCSILTAPSLAHFTACRHAWYELNNAVVSRCSGTVAGPSGTTANVLVLATLFGFTPSELAVLRLTMCAWMLVTDDHSFFEIMLGAQPHMPPELQIDVGLRDLGQLWPRTFAANTVGGEFRSYAVWDAVAAAMRTPEGARLLSAMTPEARQYVVDLLAPEPVISPPPPPSSVVIGLVCAGCLLLLVAVAAVRWRRTQRSRDAARTKMLVNRDQQSTTSRN